MDRCFRAFKGKEAVRNEAVAFPDDKQESLEGKENKERKAWIEGGQESGRQDEGRQGSDRRRQRYPTPSP